MTVSSKGTYLAGESLLPSPEFPMMSTAFQRRQVAEIAAIRLFDDSGHRGSGVPARTLATTGPLEGALASVRQWCHMRRVPCSLVRWL